MGMPNALEEELDAAAAVWLEPLEPVAEAEPEVLAEPAVVVALESALIVVLPQTVARQSVMPSRSLGCAATHWETYSSQM